jgi:hypothetical protein
MTQKIWNERLLCNETIHMTGTRRLNGTLNGAAAVDAGGGFVDIAITNHGLTAGCYIQIAGSVAYNGVHRIVSAPDANTIRIQFTYVAEVFAGTETYRLCFQPYDDFELLETRVKLSDASAAENLVYLLGANAGAAFDVTLDTQAMNGLTEDIVIWRDATKRRFFEKGDVIAVTYANTNNRTWGLTLIARMRA